MTLPIKEYQHNNFTGQVTIEYSDDSTRSFNMNNVVTAETNPLSTVLTIPELCSGNLLGVQYATK